MNEFHTQAHKHTDGTRELKHSEIGSLPVCLSQKFLSRYYMLVSSFACFNFSSFLFNGSSGFFLWYVAVSIFFPFCFTTFSLFIWLCVVCLSSFVEMLPYFVAFFLFHVCILQLVSLLLLLLLSIPLLMALISFCQHISVCRARRGFIPSKWCSYLPLMYKLFFHTASSFFPSSTSSSSSTSSLPALFRIHFIYSFNIFALRLGPIWCPHRFISWQQHDEIEW